MFRWTFHARPRHPLMRILVGFAGVVVVLAVLAFSVVAAAALLVGGAFVLLINALRGSAAGTHAGEPAKPPPDVIEGEFQIVHDARRSQQPTR